MRVFFKESSNILEITNQINRYKSDTYLMSLASTDAIYIATDFPLNHLYVKMGDTVNETASTLSIHYWSNNDWKPVVHLNDYTESFAQSGFIEFTPDRDENWTMDDTNSNNDTIDELSSIVVYDKYWIRITTNTSIDNNIELEYIGNIFSDDNDLFSEYPIFNDSGFIAAFETGKVNWQEQHVKAADLIVQDLKRKNIILGKEQILEREILLPASVCKVAEIIFNAFGNDYAEQLKRARVEYDKRMDLSNFVIDDNNDGIASPLEIRNKQGWLSR